MNTQIDIPRDEIAAFCERWQLAEFALVGSVLRGDPGPESDVDVLVEFKPGCTPGFFGIVDMETELSELFGREMTLVTRAAVERSQNYIRRKAILDSAEVIYAG